MADYIHKHHAYLIDDQDGTIASTVSVVAELESLLDNVEAIGKALENEIDGEGVEEEDDEDEEDVA